MMTFQEWLMAYKRDNRIGDLARDVRRDPPKEANYIDVQKVWDAKRLREHMVNRRACREALEALSAAKQAYKRYVAKCNACG